MTQGHLEKWGGIYIVSQLYSMSQQHCMFSKYLEEAMGLLLGHGLAKPLSSPKDGLFKSSSLCCPGCVLPKSCLQAFSLVRSLTVTPEKQHTQMSVQISKALLVLLAQTKEAFMAYMREEGPFQKPLWYQWQSGRGRRHQTHFQISPWPRLSRLTSQSWDHLSKSC